MKTFPLTVVTPYGQAFAGEAEELIIRTTTGDMGILAGHTDCVAPLGMGRATVVTDGKKRYAACIGGMVVITKEEVKLVPTTFEWAETIDVKRAEASENRAKAMLEDKNVSKTEMKLAEARLKRALVRKSVAGLK